MESLGILAGGLAHDFNNFLMTIMLNIGTARLKIEDPKVQELLEAAETSVDRAKSITMQLLTFSRGGEPVKMTLDLRPLIMESAQFALLGKPVEAQLNLEDDLPLVEADAGQLNQVMNNLLINAVYAMPKGGIVRVTARSVDIYPGDVRKMLSPGRYVEIAVEDNGVGIPAAILDSIFDPYFTTRSSGSGLGLSSCYSIVTRHGGWITVSSEIEAGSTFTFYLPAKAGESPYIAQKQRSHPGSGSILIMDDDETIRLGLVGLLKVMGYDATATSEGAEAIEVFKNAENSGHGFDLVILDITVLRGMGGIETVQEIIKFNPAAKAIVSSGYATDPVMANFKEYGFQTILPKPFSPENLTEVLGIVLSG